MILILGYLERDLTLWATSYITLTQTWLFILENCKNRRFPIKEGGEFLPEDEFKIFNCTLVVVRHQRFGYLNLSIV